jgi:hypothetical protein
MLMGNCLANVSRDKEICWKHYEGELPAEQELEGINVVILIGWRNKWNETLDIVLDSKVLALGSAANTITELLKGTLAEKESTVPNITEAVLTHELQEYRPFATNASKLAEQPTTAQFITCHSHIITEVPESSVVLAETSDQIPIAYAIED